MINATTNFLLVFTIIAPPLCSNQLIKLGLLWKLRRIWFCMGDWLVRIGKGPRPLISDERDPFWLRMHTKMRMMGTFASLKYYELLCRHRGSHLACTAADVKPRLRGFDFKRIVSWVITLGHTGVNRLSNQFHCPCGDPDCICFNALSILKEPTGCRCGNSLKVARNFPVTACAGTNNHIWSAIQRRYILDSK